MSNKTVNISLLVAALVILAAIAFFVRVGTTADAVVYLKTSGMTCGGCADRVVRALQSEKGVAATEVDLSRGCVIAGYDSKQVAPEKLVQRIVAAGYRATVQKVLTPQQFRESAGRDICAGIQQQGCCGSKWCGEK